MFDPCFHLWQQVRWENAQTPRYYEARVAKNLLDEWEVLCVGGGIGTRLGGSTVILGPRLTTPTSYLKKSMPDELNGTIYGLRDDKNKYLYAGL